MQPWQLDHRVLQADDCGRSVPFRAALGFLYLLHQTSLGVFWSTGQQLQPRFHVVWSYLLPLFLMLCSRHTMKSHLQQDLGDYFSRLGHEVCALSVSSGLGTFPLGMRLEGKGDFAAYQPMISVAVCTGHHSGV